LSHLLQPVSAFDELYQSFHEARCRSTVDDIVVEGDRQVEHVARFDALLDDGRFAGDATHDQGEGSPARRQAPATAATGHARRCHGDRAPRNCRARGIAAADGADESDEQPGQRPRADIMNWNAA
jgi:hypothetical protein